MQQRLQWITYSSWKYLAAIGGTWMGIPVEVIIYPRLPEEIEVLAI